MNRKGLRLGIMAALIGLVLLLALVKLLPVFVDKAQLKASIEKGLRESMGVHFRIQDLTMESTLFQGLQVHLNTTTITDANRNALGDIENISIQIRYIPLFTRRVPEIAKIHLNRVTIPVGKYNLFEELEFNFKDPEEKGFIKPAKMRDTEILLSNLRIEDTVLSSDMRVLVPRMTRFRMESPELSIRHLQSDKPLSVLGSGNLLFSDARGKRVPMSRFKLLAEMPQRVSDETYRPSARDLSRLNLDLNGSGLDLAVAYKHQKNQQATGTLNSGPLHLAKTQALTLQLGDTFGLPVPEALSQVYLGGEASIQDDFDLKFTGPNEASVVLKGRAHLRDVALTNRRNWPRALVHHLNGWVDLNGDVISTDNLTLRVANLPVRLRGVYNVNTKVIDAVADGRGFRLASLRQLLASTGADMNAFQGRDLQGLLDFNARITGTSLYPKYQGTLVMHDGLYRDPAQGLLISNADANFRFAGAGIDDPRLRYDGVVNIRRGSLNNRKNNLAVGSLNGSIRVSGLVAPDAPAPAIPKMNGAIRVGQGQYQDPETGLLVRGIQGLLRLAGETIHLENFNGMLGSSRFNATGTVSTNLKNYDVRLTSRNINLQRFKDEVLVKLPNADALLAQLQPYGGLADVDMNVSTGARLRGRVNVSALALRTGMEEYPITIPRLAVLFDNNRVTIPSTVVNYGPVALRLAGYFSQPGQYNFNVNSEEIPVALMRDHAELITAFSGMEIPEIWNTEGSFGINGNLSHRATTMTMDFHNAGLSWRGGEFPLYDMNGRLFYKQIGNGKPIISTRDLAFQYGNSPIAMDIENGKDFRMEANGVLSDLVVNHFLVSPKSRAVPYREIPFHATANGILAALPGSENSRNDIVADIRLDLNKTFKEGMQETRQSAVREAPADNTLNEERIESPEETADEPENRITVPSRPDMLAAENEPDARLENTSGNDNDPEEDKTSLLRRLNPLRPIRKLAGAVGLARQKLLSGLDTLRHREEAEAKEAIVEPPREPKIELPVVTETIPDTPPQLESAPMVATVAGDDNAYLNARIRLLGPDIRIEPALLHLFEAGNLVVEGDIRNALAPENRKIQLHIATTPHISLARLSHSSRENDFFREADGALGADLYINSDGQGNDTMTGWFAAEQARIPHLTVNDLTGRIDFNGRMADIGITTFNVPGINAALTGRTEDVFEFPITLEDVRIAGPLLSIASMTDFNQNIVQGIIVDQLVHNFARPGQNNASLPFQFRDATLNFDEVIFKNIILGNMSGRFSVYANGFFEILNAHLDAAGGKARGYLSMNPKDNNFMTLELSAQDVKANALTKALLNTTNQIFGDLDGTVRFTTFGETEEEMTKNANGTVSMTVTDGRLPAIAKVETLLTTANVLRGGILGLNLNNLFRTLRFYNTNYFAELSGDLLIAEGVLYTDNTISDGINLDLYIQGSLQMVEDGDANLLVNGRMSQDVAGYLGPIGKLSVGSIIKFIPGIGTFGEGRTGLIGSIPGVGYIPGFGGPAEDFNWFQVRLVGPLDDPAAVQGFQWVKPQNL